jgi:hypothetical protein
MRNYVKRGGDATTVVDGINIMNPISLPQRASYTVTGRAPAHWPGLDFYNEGQPRDGSVEGAVVGVFCTSALDPR